MTKEMLYTALNEAIKKSELLEVIEDTKRNLVECFENRGNKE